MSKSVNKLIKKAGDKYSKLGTVVVAFGNEASFSKLIDRLIHEKRPGDAIVIIDNHSEHGCAAIAEQNTGIDLVIRSTNIGFAAGGNMAASKMPPDIQLLLFLNPDILPLKGAITELRTKANPDWSAWMGLLTLPNGKVNSAGNIVHLSGLSWCDSYNQPIDQSILVKQNVDILSGACMLIKKEVWNEIGGFAEEYFMYYEDTDISMTMHQMGLKIGIVPSAHFEHDYFFNKGRNKWFYLERNRYIFISRQWPLKILIIMLPLLFITEIGLWVFSALQGRLLVRLQAVGSFIKIIPQVLRGRKIVREYRTINNVQFLRYLNPEISNPLLGEVGKSMVINRIFNLYYKFMIRIIRN